MLMTVIRYVEQTVGVTLVPWTWTKSDRIPPWVSAIGSCSWVFPAHPETVILFLEVSANDALVNVAVRSPTFEAPFLDHEITAWWVLDQVSQIRKSDVDNVLRYWKDQIR